MSISVLNHGDCCMHLLHSVLDQCLPIHSFSLELEILEKGLLKCLFLASNVLSRVLNSLKVSACARQSVPSQIPQPRSEPEQFALTDL